MKLYLYLDPELLDRGEIGIFGLDYLDLDFYQASLRDLQIDLLIQKRLLEIDLHPDGEIVPELGILVLEEGEYIWNQEIFDYVRYIDEDFSRYIDEQNKGPQAL